MIVTFKSKDFNKPQQIHKVSINLKIDNITIYQITLVYVVLGLNIK